MGDTKDLERGIVDVLSDLPIPIVVLLPGECGDEWRYEWRCLDGRGVALSLDRAVGQALYFLIGRLAG